MWGLPVSGVPGHYLGASPGSNSPPGLEQRLLFKHGHYAEKVQILLLRAIRVWHPGAMTSDGDGGGGGWGQGDLLGVGVIAHLTESPD